MLAEKDEAIGVAVGKLKELSWDESLRMLAESRQIAQWDEESRMRGAMNTGLAKGRQEGLREGVLAVVRKALAENLPVTTIQMITGLSRDEILMLQDEGERKH